MEVKWIGAILVFAGCGSVGLAMALNGKREILCLRELICALEYMSCELEYRLPSLPELCIKTSEQCTGNVSAVFKNLGKELEAQISPDVSCCMAAALQKGNQIPELCRNFLLSLGKTLGQFDLEGQQKGLAKVHKNCEQALLRLENNGKERLRSYQTLGLCAGAALAILLI